MLTLGDQKVVPAYNWWNEALHGVARAGTAARATDWAVFSVTMCPVWKSRMAQQSETTWPWKPQRPRTRLTARTPSSPPNWAKPTSGASRAAAKLEIPDGPAVGNHMALEAPAAPENVFQQRLAAAAGLAVGAERLFTTRYLLGVLGEGSEYDSIPYEAVECPEHLALAHKAALEQRWQPSAYSTRPWPSMASWMPSKTVT